MAVMDITKKKKKSKQMEKNKSLEADIENMEPQTDKVESPTKKLKTNPNDKSASDESKTDDKTLAADLKKRLEADKEYIDSLISMVSLPENTGVAIYERKKKANKRKLSETYEDSDDTDEEGGVSMDPTRSKKHLFVSAENRAQTHAELKERYQKKLEEARLREGTKPGAENKPKLSKAEKRIERKKKAAELRQKKMLTAAGMKDRKELEPEEEVEPKEEVEEGKLVYSKMAFDDPNEVKIQKKKHLDPKKALAKLQHKQEKLKAWKDAGKLDKAHRVENTMNWENALDKASGVKVKDNIELLQKTIKRRESAKKKSTKEWKEREEKVKQKEKDKVAKRNENISKRKKSVKDNKKKKLINRGRIIPGI